MRQVYAAPFEPAPGRVSYVIVDSTSETTRRVHVASDWIMERGSATDSHNTLRSMAESLAQWWEWCHHHSVDPLKTDAVRFSAFVSALSSVPKGYPLHSEVRAFPGDPRCRTSGTVHVRVTHIRAFYKWALANGRVAVPTGMSISAYKAPRVDKVMRADRLLPHQVGALLDANLSPRDRFGIELLYGAGLREGEALGLKIEDMCLNRDVAAALGCHYPGSHLHVRQRVNPNGARSKSRRERIVPLTLRVRTAYRGWQAWSFEHLPEAIDSPYLLLSTRGPTRGRPMSPSGFRSVWERHVRSAVGLEAATPHLLRHTFASELIDAGVDPFVVQELLGHASPESTQIYTHAHVETLTQAVDGLAIWRRERIGLSE